jgi:hypothetical protein
VGVITRPELPHATTGLAESIAESEEKLQRRFGGERWEGKWTPYFVRAAWNNAVLRSWLDPDDPGIRASLEQVACASAAAHGAALTPGSDPIVVPAPGGRTVEVARAQRPQQLEPPVQWRRGILAAMVTRQAEAGRALAGIDVDRLVRLSHVPPDWFAPETRVWQALALAEPDGDVAAVISGAAGEVDRATVDPQSQPWVREIVQPTLRGAAHLGERNPSAFDDALHDAVHGHSRYYGRPEALGSDGRIALAALALACLAHDRGMATTLRTDYAPRWLVENTPAPPARP